MNALKNILKLKPDTGVRMHHLWILIKDIIAEFSSTKSEINSIRESISSSQSSSQAYVIATTTLNVLSAINEFSSTVTNSSVSPTSKIIANHSPSSDSDANFGETIGVFAKPGTGEIEFTIIAISSKKLFGEYIINYTVSE